MELDNPRGRLVSTHLSVEREKQLLLALKSIFLVMIFCGTALAAFPFYAWLQLKCFLLLLLSSSGVFAVATGLVGLIGAGRTEKELDDRPKSERHLDRFAGQDLLMLGLYMSLCLTAACLVLGAEVYFFKEDSLQGISSLDVRLTSESALDASGWIGVLTAALSSCTIPCLISLSLDYEAIHNVVQMCNYVLMILGIGIAHISAVYLRYRDQMDIDEILPGWVLWFAFITGAELVLFAFYGFYVAYYEHLGTARLYVGLNLVFMIDLMICCLVFFHFSKLFDQELPYSCLDTMAIIDQEYMGTIGCPDKYVARDYTAEGLPCKSEEVRLIWEENVGVVAAARNTEYGCLNTDCCQLVTTNSDLRFHILLLFSIGALMYAALCLVTSCYLVDKIVMKARSALHSADVKVIVLMVCSVIASSALFFAVLPEVPINPYKHAGTLVLDAGLLNDRFLADGVCVKPPSVEASTAECNDCESVYAYANLTSENGYLKVPNRAGVTVTTEGNIVSLKSLDADLINKSLKKILFCPYCLERESSLGVIVSSVLTHGKRQLRETEDSTGQRRTSNSDSGPADNSTTGASTTEGTPGENSTSNGTDANPQNDTEPVDTTPKVQEIVVFNQTFPILVNSVPQTVTQQVYSNGSPLQNVKATLARPHCDVLTAISDSHGSFTFNLQKISDFTPYYFPLNLDKEGYVSTTIVQQIGGIPIYNMTQASISLPIESNITASISGTSYSVLSNYVLPGVLIQIRTGYDNFTGPVISQVLTGPDGNFIFSGLPAGVYSLISSKVGYFSDVADVVAEGNSTGYLTMLMSPQNINRDMLRVTLSWKSQQDLYLEVAFVVNDVQSCVLSGVNKECGGAKLTTLDAHGGLSGGESITLKEVGPYQYAFYVTQPVGVAGSLFEAGVEVEVYVESSQIPIARLQQPAADSPSSIWLAFCLNGLEGVTSLMPVQLYLSSDASPTQLCAELFGIPETISLGANVTAVQASPQVGEALPNLVWQQRL